ncbi:MAG: GlsB/YeaQ/YmgE family stress response membrane protein [Candidatus Levybacteria bacterium]|nr:GlsB/YeaQ/YmgE family stress response membrane protein [Candidatus Levybacteria bacterium]
MSILLWIVFGALAGWLASIIMKTNKQQGILIDVVLGIIGAVVGGLMMNLVGQPGVTGFNLYSILVSIVGATVLISLARFVYH